ncbi:MAG TPA: hypothetical protein VGM30_23740 [Puia sp.]
MSNLEPDKIRMFEHFVDLYSPSVYSAIVKLTGLTDEGELEKLTIEVFTDLWKNNEELFDELQPPALLYRTLLHHIFLYLKRHGSEDHILQLQNLLLIDPAHYAPFLKPEKKTSSISFLGRIKDIWKRE